jgi:hypothetical protein
MLEESPVADALLQLARSEPGLTTPTSELHARLARNAGKRTAASADWPKTPSMFAHELRRIAPQLRLQGLSIAFERRNDGHYISLGWEPVTINRPSCPTHDTQGA